MNLARKIINNITVVLEEGRGSRALRGRGLCFLRSPLVLQVRVPRLQEFVGTLSPRSDFTFPLHSLCGSRDQTCRHLQDHARPFVENREHLPKVERESMLLETVNR